MPPETVQSARRSTPVRRWLYLLAGVMIGGIFFYITARNINFDEALAAIYAIDSIWILPFTLLWLLNIVLRSVRWQFMFPVHCRPSLRHAVDGFLIGKVGNNFMPGRLGEVVRASVIGKLYPVVGVSGSLATVMLEKVLDSLTILILLGIALLFAPLPAWIINAGISLISVFAVLLLVLWLIGKADSRNMFSAVARPRNTPLSSLRSIATDMVRKFSMGLHALRTAQHFTLACVLTLVIWGGETVMMYAVMQAFSISAPFMAGVVSLVFLCIGGMVPAAPGFIGTYQLFIVAGMQLYGVAETDAFALSIFLNVYVIVVTSVIGVIAIFMEGGIINFRQLYSSAAKRV